MSTEPTNDALSEAPKKSSLHVTSDGPTPRTISLPSRPDFEVLEFIGRGGYGEVFLARDKEGVFWAVKVVYRISFDHDRPFEREYEGISKFEPISRLSESQLQILHVGRRDDAGYFYYIMELADDISRMRDIKPGEYSPHTLKSELHQRRRIAPGECCHLLRTLTIALGNLHRHRLVHRDIKPANIVFVDGRPKLADLGLVTDADKSMTCAGTEGYFPPEGPGSARADIYSLGMVLYEAMTGNSRWDFPRLPQDIEEWEDHKTALALNRIIGKACHANLRKRYQSTQEMERDLDEVILGAGQNSGSLMLKRARKLFLNKVVLCAALCALAFIVVLQRARFVGRSADPGTRSKAASSVIAPAATGGNNPVSPDVPTGLDGQWQGQEKRGGKHWQALVCTRSPEGNLQAEMKDITLGNTKIAQSIVLDGNHLKIVFEECIYEGNIDYALKRISGTWRARFGSWQIPLQLDYMGGGNITTPAKELLSAVSSSLIGQWHGLEEGGSKHWQALTFTKSPEGNLQAELKDVSNNYKRIPQSLVLKGNHLKAIFNEDNLLVIYEGDIDYAHQRISGTLSFPQRHADIPLHLDYMGAGDGKPVASSVSGGPDGRWLGQLGGGLFKFTFTSSPDKSLHVELKNLVDDTTWLGQSVTVNENHLVMDLKNQINGNLSSIEGDVNYESNYIAASWGGNKKWRLYYFGQ